MAIALTSCRPTFTRAGWAERKARGLAMSIAADHMRMREQTQVALRDAENRRNYALERIEGLERTITALDRRIRDDEAARYGIAAKRLASAQRARRMLAESRAQAAHYYANWKEEVRREASHGRKRADSATRARRLLATSRKAAAFQRQRADVLAAQLDKLRADMADPIQPERASDIARLVRERDEARNAAAATSARNASLQAALNSLGDKLEAMAVKVTLAERAARVASPIAV